MPKRERKTKPATKQEKERAEVEASSDEEVERLKAESDALLDEIDSVLEENAEEFVKNYRQKGGE